jgi:hypothetical protein
MHCLNFAFIYLFMGPCFSIPKISVQRVSQNETQSIYLDTRDMENDEKLFDSGWFNRKLFNNVV